GWICVKNSLFFHGGRSIDRARPERGAYALRRARSQFLNLLTARVLISFEYKNRRQHRSGAEHKLADVSHIARRPASGRISADGGARRARHYLPSAPSR
ncbi:hypothetical protein EVAR_69147_1, partial [Eumeta japonica]